MQQLDPKAVWLFFIKFILGRFIFIIFFIIYGLLALSNTLSDLNKSTSSFELFKWLWIIIPALFIFFWIWAKLTYYFYWYELREDGFRKELGVIQKKYTTIPYNRIQNVDIYRGVIDRILGLSDLHIQTAGASGLITTEGRLPGLSREVAEQLRDELIRRAQQSRTTNQGL